MPTTVRTQPALTQSSLRPLPQYLFACAEIDLLSTIDSKPGSFGQMTGSTQISIAAKPARFVKWIPSDAGIGGSQNWDFANLKIGARLVWRWCWDGVCFGLVEPF